MSIKFLEDLGYFCVDNLPAALILKFVEMCSQSQGKIEKAAIVVDIRGGQFFDPIIHSLEEVKQAGYQYDILFLEASNETLINRYKLSRRKHPLSPEGRILTGLMAERKRLAPFKAKANNIIDTTNLSQAELKEEILYLLKNVANRKDL